MSQWILRQWPTIREALLEPLRKYVDEIQENLRTADKQAIYKCDRYTVRTTVMIRTGDILKAVELQQEIGAYEQHSRNLVYPERRGEIDKINVWCLIARINY